MRQEDVQAQLSLAHFLRGMDETSLARLASTLPLKSFQTGENLLTLGDPLDQVYLILDGRVERTAFDAQGDPQFLETLKAGAVLGLFELFSDSSVQATAVAQTQTYAVAWEKTALVSFLHEHPLAMASLRLSARSRKLALALRMDWLAEGETVIAAARKHTIRLVSALLLPVLLLIGAAILALWAAPLVGALGGILAGALGLAGLAYGAWQWVDYRNDYYIVTDQRVVRLEKIVALYDSHQEAPLHQILSVSLSTDALGRLLDYGDVIIRTYTGQIQFPSVGAPRGMASMVEEQWRRHQIIQRETDRQDIEKAVHRVLSNDTDEEAGAAEPETTQRSIDPEKAPQLGLDHWGFQLRFESEGVITYRKHWAVLFGQIGPPTLAILVTVAFLGARLGGLFQLATVVQSAEAVGGLLIPLGLWWIYRYVDWANDIYQVTPTHIIDVYKKPLGREIHKIAPLENLLSTEVDRHGLIGILLNFGNVTAKVGIDVFDFEGVFNPGQVQQDVVRAQEAFLSARRMAERQQRQDEMVEWLSVYHGQVSGQEPDASPSKDLDDYP